MASSSIHNGDGGQAAYTSAVQSSSAADMTAQQERRERSQSRSPRRFARLRQTRVASLSPTPTFVNGMRGGRSLSRGRREGQGDGTSADRAQQRSASRFREPAQDAERQEDASEGQRNEKPNGSVDLEKGGKRPKDGNSSSKGGKEEKPRDYMHRFVPRLLLHFFGFRSPGWQNKSLLPWVNKMPKAVEAHVWMLIGAFVGISIVQLVFARPAHFSSSVDLPPHAWASPIIVGSFGASSVLLYAAPASPLSQPRCFIGGQFFSALIGVCVTKLFQLSPKYNLSLTDNASSIVWVCGGLATACALCLMVATGTMHPPGGATALLCATNMQVARLSWRAIPIVLLSSCLMVVWTCIWMNLGRKQYPQGFFIAAPPKGSDGNLSQYLVDYVCAKYAHAQSSSASRRKRESNSNEGRRTDGDAATKPRAPTHVEERSAWRDESTWGDSSSRFATPSGGQQAQTKEQKDLRAG